MTKKHYKQRARSEAGPVARDVIGPAVRDVTAAGPVVRYVTERGGGAPLRRDVIKTVETMLRAYPVFFGVPVEEAVLWRGAIEEAMDEQPTRRRMVELRYFEGLTEEEVQERLPLGRTCYIKWRADIVHTVAAKAAYRQLLAP